MASEINLGSPNSSPALHGAANRLHEIMLEKNVPPHLVQSVLRVLSEPLKQKQNVLEAAPGENKKSGMRN